MGIRMKSHRYFNAERNTQTRRKLQAEICPWLDRENYDFVYLDDIDKGEPFVTEDDKFRDECVKKRKIYY